MAHDPVTRRLSAILAADVAGYSRLMGLDEADTLARFRQIRTDIVDPQIARCGGTLVGTAGDSLLVEFASALAAVECAIACQHALAALNAHIPAQKRIAFRMGINLGDVIPADGTIHGDGVNIAARIEKLAEAGGLCISGSVFEQVRGKVPVPFTDGGEHTLRNIGNPVRVYHATLDALAESAQADLHLSPAPVMVPHPDVGEDGFFRGIPLPDGARSWRRPAVLTSLIVILVAVVAIGVWQTVSARRTLWARDVAIPEIERLQKTERSLEAVRLAREAEAYAPSEVARAREAWLRLDITTDPEGAAASVRNYLDEDGPWEPLGQTPLQGYPLPQGMYRLRVTKPGYEPLDIGYMPGRPPVALTPAGGGEAGMVRVSGGRIAVGVNSPVEIPAFWIGKHEVTNREFKAFVDAGGYQDPRYWTESFRDGTRTLDFAAAVERFRDSTGRAGPATWELGSYLEGEEDFPVGGISWFEAVAFANFVGKSLPTLPHWYQASGAGDIFSDMLRLSRFDAKGPARVGARDSIGPWGAYDMAGNVKEWCINASGSMGLRYIVGGAWNEPAYRFYEPEGRDPWGRDATFGLRVMKQTGDSPAAAAPIAHVSGDPMSLVPVSDQEFDLLRSFYHYDRSPPDARVEAVDDGSPHWRKETLSFAGPTGERVRAFLFLPKNAKPPYQALVYFPSSYARTISSSSALDLVSFEFLVRGGRAVLYPVYEDTYERRRPLPPGISGVRDRNVTWAKEVFRAIDYLETRPDVDKTRIGYYSLSLGAFFGPIPVALDPRIRASVFVSGGLRFNVPIEIQTANFMPRVKTPVLLINGINDFAVTASARERFLELLGSPGEHKKLVELEGGHVPDDTRRLYQETLDWYDKYLGSVSPGDPR